ncbi:amino acid ABC transporter substrate-binding protein [Pleurocapsales cyanobacterium LEGE 06147]|nr:amino acid ABC transporter substrate-binding protein [Pleurocapsales cyanobacterium LEGE 06147]
MSSKLIAITITIFCSILLPRATAAETVLDTIERTGLLRVAIREDAAPFGYLDAGGNIRGYCLDFFALLRRKLTQFLQRDIIVIRLLKSNASNRFQLVAEGLVYLECGPNTISTEIQVPNQIEFSTAFFISGTQFLIQRDNRQRINLDSNLQDIAIGVIRNTTTEQYISDRYPLAEQQQFQGSAARMRGVQTLQQGRLDAFVSDGILLIAEVERQNLPLQNYILIPEQPLTCDRYGMILPANEPQWRNFVNSVIESKESEKLLSRWLGSLIADTRITEEECRTIVDSK